MFVDGALAYSTSVISSASPPNSCGTHVLHVRFAAACLSASSQGLGLWTGHTFQEKCRWLALGRGGLHGGPMYTTVGGCIHQPRRCHGDRAGGLSRPGIDQGLKQLGVAVTRGARETHQMQEKKCRKSRRPDGGQCWSGCMSTLTGTRQVYTKHSVVSWQHGKCAGEHWEVAVGLSTGTVCLERALHE